LIYLSCFQGVPFNAHLFLSPSFFSVSGQRHMQKFLECLNVGGMSIWRFQCRSESLWSAGGFSPSEQAVCITF